MKKFLRSFIFMLMAVSLISAPAWAVRIERGDKAFAGKITFLQDVTAKKDFSVEGSIAGNDYSKVFYVEATSGADVPHYGKTWEKPFASIGFALDQCTADEGDIIYVLPGHTKTITADSGVDIDVAGVSVICLGEGSDRPTFTFTTATTADFKMAAANTRLYNALFVTNIDGHDMAIEVSADDVEIGWCEFREGTHQPEFGIQIGASEDADADRCWIHGCKFYVPTAGDGDAAISFIKDMTGVKIERCVAYGDFDLACIDVPSGGNAQVDLLIQDCVLTNLLTAQHAIQVNGTGSTGKIIDCYLESDAIGTSIDAGGLEPFNVLWSDGTDQEMAALALGSVAGASTFSTAELAAIEGEATDAIEANALDHLAASADGTGAYPESVVEDSILAKILGDDATAVATTFDNTTDSLEAIGVKTTDLDYWQERATSVSADEVTANLFDVDGGPILITSIVGYVTTVIGSNATTAQLIVDRDDSATDTEFTTAVAITDDVVGSVYVFSDANPAVLTPLTPGACGSSTLMSPWFCPEGMIEQAMSADPGGDAGAHITWYMTYIPLATGVIVTAQ